MLQLLVPAGGVAAVLERSVVEARLRRGLPAAAPLRGRTRLSCRHSSSAGGGDDAAAAAARDTPVMTRAARCGELGGAIRSEKPACGRGLRVRRAPFMVCGDDAGRGTRAVSVGVDGGSAGPGCKRVRGGGGGQSERDRWMSSQFGRCMESGRMVGTGDAER